MRTRNVLGAMQSKQWQMKEWIILLNRQSVGWVLALYCVVAEWARQVVELKAFYVLCP